MRKLKDKDRLRLLKKRLPLMPFRLRHRRRLMSLPKQRQKLPPRPRLRPKPKPRLMPRP